ncbi:MAG: DUF2339 domain-containing protein [Sphingomonas sp.]|jgi:uncharacterized membrane protein|uniref:DUF2339 domain-containing protein n=1 Tax=Sphingomonas sp. TaxID=28214 RepID=UPI0035674245
MILWGVLVGALLGWIMADFESWGFVAGAILGTGAGAWLALAVRAHVARATRALRDEIAELRDMRATPAVAERAPSAKAPLEATPAMVRPPAAAMAEAPGERATIPQAAGAATPEDDGGDVGHAGGGQWSGKAVVLLRRWLFGGNTIVRVGLVILFIGLAFLANYAAAAGLFPIEVRLAAVVAVGIVLLVVGFRTRMRRPAFGLALQGGGVATIYLTIFAAARVFDVMPVAPAYALMILVSALGCALALLQNAQSLAVISSAGGFAVPLLLADKGGSAAALFGYYAILNLAILFVATRRAWRGLSLLGFFATFGIATLWGVTSYQPADYPVAQFFLALSVLIYVLAGMLYARATPGPRGNLIDTTLLFGPAIAGFGLQVGLVHDRAFGSAFAAIGFAALYLGLASVAARRRDAGLRTLQEAMLAIGVGFVTLAVPLALDARWTSSAWALEGAGAFWVGMRQARWMPRLFGLLLQGVAALVLMSSVGPDIARLPLANPAFVGTMLIALPALATAWWLRSALPHSGSTFARGYVGVEAGLGRPMFLWGFLFWCAAWIVEALRALPPQVAGGVPVPVFDPAVQGLLVMLGFVASAWGWSALGRRRDWDVATWPGRVTIIPLAVALLGEVASGRHVLEAPGWTIWLVAIALHLHLLNRNDRSPARPAQQVLATIGHVGGAWLATAILADSLWLAIDHAALWHTSWAGVVYLLSAVAVLVALSSVTRTGTARFWPFDGHAAAYYWLAAVPLELLVFVGALVTALVAEGVTDPLPYLPLLNPVDLSLGLALAALFGWRRAIAHVVPTPPASSPLTGRPALVALSLLGFVMINSVWLRLAHHWLGVGWAPEALLDSFVVQTGIAILWTLLALAMTIAAHRRGLRVLWMAGAALLGLVVVKLILIDLTNAGGAARIVAFLVVGALMLVVGYAAPLPPRREESEAVA